MSPEELEKEAKEGEIKKAPRAKKEVKEEEINEAPTTKKGTEVLTKEEIVHSKNTFGFARAIARKIGVWHAADRRFKLAKWLPDPAIATDVAPIMKPSRIVWTRRHTPSEPS